MTDGRTDKIKKYYSNDNLGSTQYMCTLAEKTIEIYCEYSFQYF